MLGDLRLHGLPVNGTLRAESVDGRRLPTDRKQQVGCENIFRSKGQVTVRSDGNFGEVVGEP